MSRSVAFENPFDEYTKDAAVIFTSAETISEEFKQKINKFKIEKLDKLTNELRSDIFYDDSVYTGSAGVALLYYTFATRFPQPNHDLLLKSLEYIKLDKLKGKRISFLCGDAGPLSIAAVVAYKLGSWRPNILPDYKSVAKRLVDLASLLNDSPDELLYGRSGYLYALLFVNKHIGKGVISSDHIEMVVQAILCSGKQFAAKMKSDSPLLWQWHDKVYIGGAHGVAGILYQLLQARHYISAMDMRSLVLPTLRWVLGLQFPSGNFPSSLGSSSGDRLVQWCHGAPGFVPLCILAHEVFEEGKYMKTALQCGEVVWRRGLCSKGYSLCHGVAGNAYTFIQLYQATKKLRHLTRRLPQRCRSVWTICVQSPEKEDSTIWCCIVEQKCVKQVV